MTMFPPIFAGWVSLLYRCRLWSVPHLVLRNCMTPSDGCEELVKFSNFGSVQLHKYLHSIRPLRRADEASSSLTQLDIPLYTYSISQFVKNRQKFRDLFDCEVGVALAHAMSLESSAHRTADWESESFTPGNNNHTDPAINPGAKLGS
jgi:hypothetical protein